MSDTILNTGDDDRREIVAPTYTVLATFEARFFVGRNRSDLLSAIFWMLTLPLILLFLVVSWISEQVERGFFG